MVRTLASIGLLAMMGLLAVPLGSASAQAPSPAVAGQSLGIDEIHQFLRKLDPNVTRSPERNENGEVVRERFSLSLKRRDQVIPLTVVVNSRVIWMSTPITQVAKVNDLPQDLLVRVLQAHLRIGPSFYRLESGNGFHVVVAAHRIDHGATESRIADGIIEFADDVLNTRDLWTNPKK